MRTKSMGRPPSCTSFYLCVELLVLPVLGDVSQMGVEIHNVLVSFRSEQVGCEFER